MEFQMSKEIYQMQCHLLNNLRKEGKFCDVLIQASQASALDDRPLNITAHSCILSATSFVFYKNFTLNQTTENQRSFRIFSRGIKPEIWELVLEYIYLRKMTVASGLSKENLSSLFWLLKELHLINEVEYKRILQSSNKIFGFDIFDGSIEENYAVRFEEIMTGSSSNSDQAHRAEKELPVAQDSSMHQNNDYEDQGKEMNEMATAKSTGSNAEMYSDDQKNYSEKPTEAVARVHESTEHHMHLPVCSGNDTKVGFADTQGEAGRKADENQGHSFTQGQGPGPEYSSSEYPPKDVTNDFGAMHDQVSDDDDNGADDIPETDMAFENDDQAPVYSFPGVQNEMMPNSTAVSNEGQSGFGGNVMSPQGESSSIPAGESVRLMADMINQASREELGSGAINQSLPEGSSSQIAPNGADASSVAGSSVDKQADMNRSEFTSPNNDNPIGASNIPTEQTVSADKEEHTAMEEKSQGQEPSGNSENTAHAPNEKSVAVENENASGSNDSYKSEWERLAGNFAFKNLCNISVLGKDDVEVDQFSIQSIKKERDDYEHENTRELRGSRDSKGKKHKKKESTGRRKTRKTGPWYSCSDCDQRFSTYVLFQKHQCNSNEFGKKGASAQLQELYDNSSVKTGRRTRKKRKAGNTGKWLPKPIKIVPENTRYSSENDSNELNGIDGKGEDDSQVALVSFGGKEADSDATEVDETYQISDAALDDSDDDETWTRTRKSERKLKITKKKKTLANLRSKKRGRPFGSKNRKVKALKVKIEPNFDKSDDDGEEAPELEGEESTGVKKRKGRPKGSKNKVKIKLEGEEMEQVIGSDGELREKPKKVRKRRRSDSEKTSPLKTPRSKILTEEEDLKGGMVEGTGENPAIMGRIARVFDVCNLCGEKVENGGARNLRIHRKTVCSVALSPDFKDRPKNVCPFCKKQLSRNSELNIHIKIHHMGGHPYKCRLCPEEFNTRDGVKQHMINVHDVERIKCSQCNKVFLDAKNYNKHFKYCGPDGIIPTPKQSKGCMCHICGHVSVNEGKNRVHLLYHKSPAEWDYHCEVCNQAFAQKSDLKKHRMIHTGEKPYLCDLCPYATNRTSNLKLHMRKHIAERSEVTKNQDGALVYKCVECTSTFSLKTELKDHLKVHDTKQSRCFKKFRPRTKEDMQQSQKTKKPGAIRKQRPKYQPPKLPMPAEIKKDHAPEESSVHLDEVVSTVVRDITMSSLGPISSVAPVASVTEENLVAMGIPSQSRPPGMLAMNPHVTTTDSVHSAPGGMMGLGPGPIGTEARMMGYIGMAHYGQAGGDRLIPMSGEMPVMEDRMMQIQRNMGAVDEHRMHRIRNEESMLGYALRQNMPEAAYMNL